VSAARTALPAASVSGVVTLAASLQGRAAPDDTLFVFARAADGTRMPLAILRKRVRDLPLQFTLDDEMAMSDSARLSGAQRVIVGARISKSGNAMPQSGDLQGSLGAVAVGSAGLKVEIDQEVKK
jgi:cytochrome c-type biogenesis protein CcmH